ncbi:MAG: dTDP-4-dehydrorhamnose reductase [Chitinophagaceae bacterium]|nr:MAG: dTDP-4-dehydrorhamnose reductase [Chitinophagaceae bacterium]
MKILVTGAGGQLASELEVLAAARPTDQFVFRSVTDLDITDAEAVWKAIADEEPDFCINAAAYTAVDKAETEPEPAFRVNAEGTRFLAAACAAKGARFLHVSTDYVFAGDGERPYREDDPTGPQGVYGASKRKGEELAFEAAPDTIVVRTAWVYSSFGHNFVKTMLRLMRERDSLSVVNDQQGCPTYAADLAAALLQIIDSGKWVPGIYHFSNEGATTWFRFAEAIRDRAGITCDLRPITTDQYPTPACRPAYSVLDTAKIRDTWGLSIRSWEECLDECLALLSAQS